MTGFREISADLQDRIDAGEFPAKTALPTIPELMDRYGSSRQTVRSAIGDLAAKGLVVPKVRVGTIVRDRTRIPIPMARYLEVLEPDGSPEPFETACAAVGLNGRMTTIGVELVDAAQNLAETFGVPAGEQLIQRNRHAIVDDDTVQVQMAWYPRTLFGGTPLELPGKVVGGVYAAMRAAGYDLVNAGELVKGRMPDKQEARVLGCGTAVPVLDVTRKTRQPDGRVLEVLNVVAAADRCWLVYDPIPLTPRGRS